MPAYYQTVLSTFVKEDFASILWKLVQANAAERFPLTPQAIEAWHLQLPFLVAGATELIRNRPEAKDWGLLLEYPIPIVGKRIDAVLLARNLIVVIETKTGASLTCAARQVDDYALNLACFHEFREHRTVVPLVVGDAPVAANSTRTDFDSLIERCRFASTGELGNVLENLCQQYVKKDQAQIDIDSWNQGRFRPIPPIIAAAVALYSGMDVFEIGHACTAREDLEKTPGALVQAVLSARSHAQKVICFTTGVPGAGKTLVGLNMVHRPEIKDFGVFLSGNGPLVKVLQEALVRDVVRREGMSRSQAQLEVRTFVHSVHRFADQYYGEGKQQPVENVVVFDEAQRAWDSKENERSGRPKVSEPEMMLDVMDRRSDWAVIVALIGGGQEINRGEAGLAEWGRAIKHFPHWRVLAPPNVLRADSASVFRLFEMEGEPSANTIIEAPALHLSVCTRSIRAQQISDWVDSILSGQTSLAARIAATLDEKPAITRSLATAKEWLRANRRGQTRSGLVASASAVRLRADGLESSFDFQQRFEWEHWFLDSHDCTVPDCDHKYCNDVRASSILEVAATQFKIQGLELDWVGLCWGEDLAWDGAKWACSRFNNKQWRAIKPTDHRRLSYLVNAYRVLMTRARQGMVIYIPQPGRDDVSRLHRELDLTADFLAACGAVPIDSLARALPLNPLGQTRT